MKLSLFLWQLCLELRNFNAVMAIVVAALGSAPVRRLHKTKEVRIENHIHFECLIFSLNNRRARTENREIKKMVVSPLVSRIHDGKVKS